jgi:hypothetical protein
MGERVNSYCIDRGVFITCVSYPNVALKVVVVPFTRHKNFRSSYFTTNHKAPVLENAGLFGFEVLFARHGSGLRTMGRRMYGMECTGSGIVPVFQV